MGVRGILHALMGLFAAQLS